MKLSQGEFCRFNLNSRLALLANHGQLLIVKKINEVLESRLYVLYNFYVEVFYEYDKQKALKAEPLISKQWVEFYAEEISLSELF